MSLQLGEDFKKQHPGVSFDSEAFKAVVDQVGSSVNLGTEVKKLNNFLYFFFNYLIYLMHFKWLSELIWLVAILNEKR